MAIEFKKSLGISKSIKLGKLQDIIQQYNKSVPPKKKLKLSATASPVKTKSSSKGKKTWEYLWQFVLQNWNDKVAFQLLPQRIRAVMMKAKMKTLKNLLPRPIRRGRNLRLLRVRRRKVVVPKTSKNQPSRKIHLWKRMTLQIMEQRALETTIRLPSQWKRLRLQLKRLNQVLKIRRLTTKNRQKNQQLNKKVSYKLQTFNVIN